MSCSTPVAKVSKAAKAAKKIVEKITSSEKSDLTTSFSNTASEKAVTLVKQTGGYVTALKSVFTHPKFKWIIIFVLLCGVAFYYFKFQRKNKLPIRLGPLKAQQPAPQQNIFQQHMAMKQNMLNNEAVQMQAQAQAEAQARAHAQMMLKKTQEVKKPVQRAQPIQESSDESSEEVFIEDNKVMEHNLTADEMHAIDKQLEDVHQ
jgi:hypothetical protein